MNNKSSDADPPSGQKGIRLETGSVTASQIGDNNTQYNYFNDGSKSASPAVVVPIIPIQNARPHLFVGRASELKALASLLNPSQTEASAVAVSAVAGLAGIGKSELARQAASIAVSEGWFPGGAVIVDLHGYDSSRRIEANQAFVPILTALGIDLRDIPLEPEQHGAFYHQFLTHLARGEQPALLVLDNAADQSQIIDLIPDHRSHRVLITSRHTFSDLEGARHIELDVLSIEDALVLLDQALRQRHPQDNRCDAESGKAADLIQLCGALPLALNIVAALLADEPRRPLADLVIELSDTNTRLDGLAYGDRAVRAAFDLSWQHLVERDQWAARLFRLLSVNPGPDISTAAASAASAQKTVVTGRQLRTLRRAHLVEFGVTQDRWRMHDLVNLYSTSLGERYARDDDRLSVQARLVQYYVDTTSYANSWINSRPSPEALRAFPDRPSGLKWLMTEQANLVAAVGLAHAIHEYDAAIDLSCAIVPFLEIQRNLTASLSASEMALESARALNRAVREAGVLNNIGIALTSMRRYKEAIRFLHKAVAKARQSGDKVEESTALTSLASAMRTYYGPRFGIDELQQAMQIARSLGNARQSAFAMTNLGISLREAGRFKEAEKFLRSAMAIHAATGARAAEASTVAQLATTLSQMNKIKPSISLFRQAIIAYKDVEDKNGEALATMNLGNALRNSGDIAGALKIYIASLQIFHETGDPHALALAQGNIGLTLRQLGRSEEAEQYLDAARAALLALGDHQALRSIDSE